MCLQVHMRYMLLCSANDTKCKHELWDLWCCGSKVLKQMFCADLRYYVAINGCSKAQYRPADWPVCAFLHTLLEQCQNMQAIHDVLVQNFDVQFQKFKQEELQRTSPAISNQIFEMFEKVVKLYIKYLNKILGKQTSSVNEYELLENVIFSASNTPENQLQELEEKSELLGPKKGIDGVAKALHKEWQSQINIRDKNSYKFYSIKMIKQWMEFRSKNKNAMSSWNPIEPNFDYFEEHKNVKNRLSDFLTEMSSHYTLFSTLHGVLAARSTVFQFDPVLVSELAIMKQNGHELGGKVYSALERMHHSHKVKYEKQIQENKAAVDKQNLIQQEMHAFYQQRCGRITAHPTSIDDTNKHVFRSLGGVHVLCKVFANWHFGDLGDDSRVECKQSK